MNFTRIPRFSCSPSEVRQQEVPRSSLGVIVGRIPVSFPGSRDSNSRVRAGFEPAESDDLCAWHYQFNSAGSTMPG